MRIDEIIKSKKAHVSFEIFPPKQDMEFEAIGSFISQLASLKPDFISVTYGAGGKGPRGKTVQLASMIKESGIESLAHLTCIGSRRSDVETISASLKENGIENILALRGDIPEDRPADGDYRYAKELISDLDRKYFCIGAAAYPEGHINCESMDDNIEYLYEKEQAGASFFITQLFFDNRVYYEFREKAAARGIKSQIIPGIMPMMSRAQVERMIFTCAVSLPSKIIKLLNKYADDPQGLRKAGIDYAVSQMTDLMDNGSLGMHVYAMNKFDFAKASMEALDVYR
ncbi:MAG TPA: methylenetetrahydrofolate reductase [Firmicutes bacterium]|nr:methylenetetrahydrofolate reductase [Bacillota bacterium]